MRVKKVQLIKFKRFDDLTIDLGDDEGRGKSLGTARGGHIRMHDDRNAYRRWKKAVEILTAAESPEAITFQKNLDLHFNEKLSWLNC